MISDSEKQTRLIAAGLIKKYQHELATKCLILALRGDLGSGKTVFAKGVAEALGIKKIIRSPSFIIQREFPYRAEGVEGTFIHLDLWRMESEAEVMKLKIEDSIKPGNVILIEWAEKMGAVAEKLNGLNGAKIVAIKVDFVDETKRKLEIETKRN